MKFEHWTFAEITCFVILHFFKMRLFILKRKDFYFVMFIYRFLKSKTCLNFLP